MILSGNALRRGPKASASFLGWQARRTASPLTPIAAGADLSLLMGKTVTIAGMLPQTPKGQLSDKAALQDNYRGEMNSTPLPLPPQRWA